MGVIFQLAGAGYDIYSAGKQGDALQAQYDQQAKSSEAAAIQEEAINRRKLLSVVAEQDAIRAGRGLSMTSGTALSIFNDTTKQGEADIQQSRLNTLLRADRYRMAGRNAQIESRNKQISTGIGAGENASKAAEKYFMGA